MSPGRVSLTVLACVAITAIAFAGCGSSKKNTKAQKLAVTIADAGKSTKYTAPATTKGGLVELSVTNQSKAPHGAQLVLIMGNHTAQEALKVVGSNSPKTPEWIRGEGGIGAVEPGKTANATMNLPAGKYLVVDSGGPGSNGPPGYTQTTVNSGKDGDLPKTDATITAANPAKDKYKWDISGPLKVGDDQITFDSKGKEAIHLIVGFRITKGNPSQAEIVKALKSNAPPPFGDPSSFTTTAVLDGGLAQTTPLKFTKPGKYVLFCPLSDRDGGKPHFEQGLVTTVDVK